MKTNNPLQVLVIDDDPGSTDTIATFLHSRGYKVHTANYGSAGIELAKLLDPDLVILDPKLPDMEGREFCRQMRQFSEASILILSALDEPKTVACALDAGADDYLTKPVTNGMLLARLDSLSRRMSRHASLHPSLPISTG